MGPQPHFFTICLSKCGRKKAVHTHTSKCPNFDVGVKVMETSDSPPRLELLGQCQQLPKDSLERNHPQCPPPSLLSITTFFPLKGTGQSPLTSSGLGGEREEEEEELSGMAVFPVFPVSNSSLSPVAAACKCQLSRDSTPWRRWSAWGVNSPGLDPCDLWTLVLVLTPPCLDDPGYFKCLVLMVCMFLHYGFLFGY